jgi:hypothetical protein
VSILDRATPKEQIAMHPPIAVFKVLSPEDTDGGIVFEMAEIAKRID